MNEVKTNKLFIYTFFVSTNRIAIFAHPLPDGVTGNTSDFGSEESRFEP